MKLGAVLDALPGLTNRVRRIHLSLCELRVAAREGQALEDENLRALIGRADGGRHAGAARAHDDDVADLIPFHGKHGVFGRFRGGVNSCRSGSGSAHNGGGNEFAAIERHAFLL